MTKDRGSMSSRAASEDEMECQSTGEHSEGSMRRELRGGLKGGLGKRKSEETSYGETTEDLEEEKKAGVSNKKTKEDRTMIEAKRSRQGEIQERGTEERRRGGQGNTQVERKGCSGNSNSKTEDDVIKFKKMKDGLTAIMDAAMRENGGRVAVTRADQATVRDAVFMLQHELLDLVVRQMELERENARLRGMAQGKSGGKTRGAEGVKSRRVVSRDSTESESEWQEARDGRRHRGTYAGAVRGKGGNGEDERIEGRVVVPGREGWRTPPVRKEEEDVLVIQKKEEKNARRLAEELAKSMRGKAIGGAPKAVRVVRDGKVVIVPKDKAQGERSKRMWGK